MIIPKFVKISINRHTFSKLLKLSGITIRIPNVYDPDHLYVRNGVKHVRIGRGSYIPIY